MPGPPGARPAGPGVAAERGRPPAPGDRPPERGRRDTGDGRPSRPRHRNAQPPNFDLCVALAGRAGPFGDRHPFRTSRAASRGCAANRRIAAAVPGASTPPVDRGPRSGGPPGPGGCSPFARDWRPPRTSRPGRRAAGSRSPGAAGSAPPVGPLPPGPGPDWGWRRRPRPSSPPRAAVPARPGPPGPAPASPTGTRRATPTSPPSAARPARARCWYPSRCPGRRHATAAGRGERAVPSPSHVAAMPAASASWLSFTRGRSSPAGVGARVAHAPVGEHGVGRHHLPGRGQNPRPPQRRLVRVRRPGHLHRPQHGRVGGGEGGQQVGPGDLPPGAAAGRPAVDVVAGEDNGLG